MSTRTILSFWFLAVWPLAACNAADGSVAQPSSVATAAQPTRALIPDRYEAAVGGATYIYDMINQASGLSSIPEPDSTAVSPRLAGLAQSLKGQISSRPELLRTWREGALPFDEIAGAMRSRLQTLGLRLSHTSLSQATPIESHLAPRALAEMIRAQETPTSNTIDAKHIGALRGAVLRALDSVEENAAVSALVSDAQGDRYARYRNDLQRLMQEGLMAARLSPVMGELRALVESAITKHAPEVLVVGQDVTRIVDELDARAVIAAPSTLGTTDAIRTLFYRAATYANVLQGFASGRRNADEVASALGDIAASIR